MDEGDALQSYIDRGVQQLRKESFAKTDQITLGQLINKIEEAGVTYTSYEDQTEQKDKYVEFDFGNIIPDYLMSWRGSYRELAIGYKEDDYDAKTVLAKDFLKDLKGAVGKKYYGYKGGEFKMGEGTPVWVANDSFSGETGVIDLKDNGHRLIIITSYCEY